MSGDGVAGLGEVDGEGAETEMTAEAGMCAAPWSAVGLEGSSGNTRQMGVTHHEAPPHREAPINQQAKNMNTEPGCQYRTSHQCSTTKDYL